MFVKSCCCFIVEYGIANGKSNFLIVNTESGCAVALTEVAFCFAQDFAAVASVELIFYGEVFMWGVAFWAKLEQGNYCTLYFCSQIV